MSKIDFLRWLNLPELNVAVFSFLLNFLWEMQQMPFFQIPSEFTCINVVNNCTQATVGDVGISLAAFGTVVVLSKSRRWILQPNWWQVVVFVLVGIMITIIFEALATGVLDRWQYGEVMPTLPVFGTGLLPILQWLIIPPLIIWFVKRQLSSIKPKSLN
ncbi:hypothetical protein [Myxosarcina sp. GI1]|uniref:hypothetical protein n=1 Tax=Myxosarcina sp. GI1 TaxID=1541065 RepID=UPI0005632344|nr:hypothetical protein [Myxosarcina sp. GI1]